MKHPDGEIDYADRPFPQFKLTVLCNGIPIAETWTTPGSNVQNFVQQWMNCNIIGNGRYTSMATYIRVRLDDVSWATPDLIRGRALLEIEALPVGKWAAFTVHADEDWPSDAVCGLLHWTQYNEVWDWQTGRGTGEYERFSLMFERVTE